MWRVYLLCFICMMERTWENCPLSYIKRVPFSSSHHRMVVNFTGSRCQNSTRKQRRQPLERVRLLIVGTCSRHQLVVRLPPYHTKAPTRKKNKNHNRHSRGGLLVCSISCRVNDSKTMLKSLAISHQTHAVSIRMLPAAAAAAAAAIVVLG